MKLAIIGGTGLENFLEGGSSSKVKANYGSNGEKHTRSFMAKYYKNGNVLFVNRHKVPLSLYRDMEYITPDKIDYKTLMVGLKQAGYDTVISTSAVGCTDLEPGFIGVPDDFIDYINCDIGIDYIGNNLVPFFVSAENAFNSDIREIILKSAEKNSVDIHNGGIYVRRLNNRRFETPAEVRESIASNGMESTLYFGMTAPTEALLSKMLDMKYATIAVVTNLAAGIGGEINHEENKDVFGKAIPDVEKILKGVLDSYFLNNK